MFEATSISMSYNEREDRIFVDARGAEGNAHLVLTRRITRGLLGTFATLLEKSSVAVSRAPADMRSDVIAVEHLSALRHAREPQSSLPDANPHLYPPILVDKVDVQVTRTSFRLMFHGSDGPVAGLSLSRSKFHRLVAAIDHLSSSAEWNIRGGIAWLEGSQAGPTRLVS